jgi:Cof subfamily protein (haloacid dehalogenase superfamily)
MCAPSQNKKPGRRFVTDFALSNPGLRAYTLPPLFMPTATTTPRRYRLAAFDLDGTLLGADHQVSTANARALGRLQSLGIEVVLASGRHYNAMREYGQGVPGVRWMVSAQGAEVSNVDRTQVLHQSFLERSVTDRVLALSRSMKYPAIVYTRDSIIADNDEAVAAYQTLFGYSPLRLPTEEFATRPAFKVVWAGEPDQLSRLAEDPQVAAMPTGKLRSHLHLFEFVQPDVSKATGLSILATRLGITPEETMVFGDADNDVSMFNWAGTSVAMPQAWASARAHAKFIAPDGPQDEAVARGIEMVLAKAG